MVWVGREGDEERISAPPRAYGHPRVSPDGTRVAVDVRDGDSTDVWIWDLARETLTHGPSDRPTKGSGGSLYRLTARPPNQHPCQPPGWGPTEKERTRSMPLAGEAFLSGGIFELSKGCIAVPRFRW